MCVSLSLPPSKASSGDGSALVDLGLLEVLDDTGAILEAVADLGAAERLAALDDAGIASQSGLGNTAESAATCRARKRAKLVDIR